MQMHFRAIPDDVKILQQFADNNGMNLSGLLRFLMRDWAMKIQAGEIVPLKTPEALLPASPKKKKAS